MLPRKKWRGEGGACSISTSSPLIKAAGRSPANSGAAGKGTQRQCLPTAGRSGEEEKITPRMACEGGRAVAAPPDRRPMRRTEDGSAKTGVASEGAQR